MSIVFLVKALQWDLYEGFNVILLKMTHALISSGGLPIDFKWTVWKLWDMYLGKLERASKPNEPKENQLLSDSLQTETNAPVVVGRTADQVDSILPDWWNAPPETEEVNPTEEENEKIMKSNFHFNPHKQ